MAQSLYEQRLQVRGSNLRSGPRAIETDAPASALKKVDGLADPFIQEETIETRLAQQKLQTIDRAQIQIELRQQDDEARAYSARVLSKAGLEGRKILLDMENQAVGAAVNHTENFRKVWSAYRDEILSEAPNDLAHRYINQQMTSLEANFTESAFRYEQSSRQAERLNNYEMAIDDAARTVALDPSAYPGTAGAPAQLQDQIMNAGDLPAAIKDKLTTALWEKTSEALWLGEIARAPKAAAAKLTLKPQPAVPSIKTPYDSIIESEAARFGVNPNIMKRQLMAESSGNPNAVSPKGAAGVSQFMPDTAKRYGIDPKIPAQAIKGQAAYMSDLLELFGGDYEKALAGYNWGEGNVTKTVAKYGEAWKDHIPAETSAYIRKINKLQVNEDTKMAESVDNLGNRSLTNLSVEKRLMLYNKALSESQRFSSDTRARVVAKERDDVAAFMDGKTPQSFLTEDDYVNAYGPEGLVKYQNYAFTRQVGEDISSIMSMTETQQQEMLASRAPAPGDGYAVTSERYAALQRAVATVNEARKKDPMLFAARAKIGPVEQLQLADPTAFADSVNSRGGVAVTMRDKYSAPLAPLTNDEAVAFGKIMDSMPTTQKMEYLRSLSKRVKDDEVYGALMQQIRPDSPVTSVTGRILKSRTGVQIERMFGSNDVITPDEAASRILEGEALLNPLKSDKKSDGKPRIAMPPENLLRSEWANYIGDAYRGMGQTGTEEVSYQVFRSYYAGEMSHVGRFDGQIDTNVAKKAALVATGGVANIGGRDTLLPWGMPEGQFRGKLFDEWEKVKAGTKLYKGTAYSDFNWNPIGNGKYVPMLGTGPLRGPNGAPIVLDVSTKYMANERGDLLDQIPR